MYLWLVVDFPTYIINLVDQCAMLCVWNPLHAGVRLVIWVASMDSWKSTLMWPIVQLTHSSIPIFSWVECPRVSRLLASSPGPLSYVYRGSGTHCLCMHQHHPCLYLKLSITHHPFNWLLCLPLCEFVEIKCVHVRCLSLDQTTEPNESQKVYIKSREIVDQWSGRLSGAN